MKKLSDNGKTADEVTIDTKLSVIKEVSASWLEAAYHYMKQSKSITFNGYEKSETIANSTPDDCDPLADCD